MGSGGVCECVRLVPGWEKLSSGGRVRVVRWGRCGAGGEGETGGDRGRRDSERSELCGEGRSGSVVSH